MPNKGETKYRPEYCQQLQDALKAGKTVAQFAKSINISHDAIYRWFKEYPEFGEAYREVKPLQGSYKPEYCQTVIEMMKEGAAVIEVAAKLGVTRQTFQNWCHWYPDFDEAHQIGRAYSEAWWTREGRTNLHEKTFNASVWYSNMKNRFGWRDSREHHIKGRLRHDHSHKHNVSIQELRERLSGIAREESAPAQIRSSDMELSQDGDRGIKVNGRKLPPARSDT